MNSHFLGSDRFFLIVLIAISAPLFVMIGGMEEATSPGELKASTYPRILLACIMTFSAILIANTKRDKSATANFSMKGLTVIMLIAGYIALLDTVGYFVLTPILLFILPLLAGFKQYKQIIISVALVTASLYGVFDLVLNIPLPPGFLGE
jgi:putative tricarboxylic transport membrane protein